MSAKPIPKSMINPDRVVITYRQWASVLLMQSFLLAQDDLTPPLSFEQVAQNACIAADILIEVERESAS
jgi:hypothetical protein